MSTIFEDGDIIFENGDVIWEDYDPQIPTVETPSMNPSSGAYPVETTIELSCATSGADIYYTTDGSDPTESSSLYTVPISMFNGTLKAIGIKAGSDDSEISSETYTIAAEQTAIPVILPISGEYEYGQTFEITCATEGSVIYYTTDGTTPDITDNVFSEPILISNGMNIKAIGVTAGYSDSDVTEVVNYTIKAGQPIITIIT